MPKRSIAHFCDMVNFRNERICFPLLRMHEERRFPLRSDAEHEAGQLILINTKFTLG